VNLALSYPTGRPPLRCRSVSPYIAQPLLPVPPQSKFVKLPANKTPPTTLSCRDLVTVDLLQQRKRRIRSNTVTTKLGMKRRVINTDTQGYNGSVSIPGPSKNFSTTKPSTVFFTQSHPNIKVDRRNDQVQKASYVLARQ
jgi:hypothetical protein